MMFIKCCAETAESQEDKCENVMLPHPLPLFETEMFSNSGAKLYLFLFSFQKNFSFFSENQQEKSFSPTL